MRQSRIVQRISKPQDFINPFGNNIGDTKQEYFKKFNKDYPMDLMGAAEYEFGALEKTMSIMWKVDMILKEFPMMLDEHAGIQVWMWIPKDMEINKYMDDIQSIYDRGINNKAGEEICKADYGSFADMIGTSEVVDKDGERFVGWLSLCNNYVFFLNEDSAKGFAKYIDEGGDNV